MKKAYLILAHKNLDHLLRLIDRLDDGSSRFYIHLDLKTKLSARQKQMLEREHVFLVKRISTRWGGFSLAEATLLAMKAVQESGEEFGAISLLSGQDYPIKSNADIDAFLTKSRYSIFLEYFPLPDYKRWNTGGTYRYKKYFFGTSSVALFFSKTMNFMSTLIPVFARKLPYLLRPYAGSQWWTIDQYALNYILKYIEDNPEYNQFHKFTFAPDELFFHIILLNATDEKIRTSLVNDNLRYMNWINFDNAHPEVLKTRDLSAIESSGSLFARKFDATEDGKILNLIDDRILNRG